MLTVMVAKIVGHSVVVTEEEVMIVMMTKVEEVVTVDLLTGFWWERCELHSMLKVVVTVVVVTVVTALCAGARCP